jgi:receptor expression-enhancing protein 5/6
MSFDIEKFHAISHGIEKSLREIPICRKIYETTSVPLVYMIAAMIACSLLTIYLLSGLRAITMLVATVYPAYKTLLAINSENKEDDTLWLCYWVFYGIFSTIESITDILLFWLPAYELLKMVLYVYLYAGNGAIVFYIKLLKPLVAKMQKLENQGMQAVNDLRDTVLNQAQAQAQTGTATATATQGAPPNKSE